MSIRIDTIHEDDDVLMVAAPSCMAVDLALGKPSETRWRRIGPAGPRTERT